MGYPVNAPTAQAPEIVRCGYVGYKKVAFLSWFWRNRFLVLRGQNLSVHKTETAPAQSTVSLDDLSKLERTDRRPHCLLLEARGKQYFLDLKSDTELYDWQDDIYNRSSLSGISNPTGFMHNTHVGYDTVAGAVTGMPDEWRRILSESNVARAT